MVEMTRVLEGWWGMIINKTLLNLQCDYLIPLKGAPTPPSNVGKDVALSSLSSLFYIEDKLCPSSPSLVLSH